MLTKQAVIQALQALPEDATEDDIREQLEEFFPSDTEEDGLFDELERRRAEFESGKDPGIPAEEVFRRLREATA